MDGIKPSALDRARADLASGRPDRARDRITGYLHSHLVAGAYSEETYALLGEIYFEMRDFPKAGAAWLLTERDDAAAHMAFAAFTERYGSDPVNVLNAVKPRARSELYPPRVQERLKAWTYRYLPYRGRGSAERSDGLGDDGEEAAPPGVRPIEAGCIVAVFIGFVLACMYVYLTIFGRR